MAIDRNDTDERQARLDTMIEEFRAAQQRQLVKREIGAGEACRGRTAGVWRAACLPPRKFTRTGTIRSPVADV